MPVSKAEKHSKAKTGKLSPEFGESRILEFCAFAEKNAVSLAKPDCKGALAHKKPLLTKRPKPKPTNSAYAELGNQKDVCPRDVIKEGVKMLGMELIDVILHCLEGMKFRHEELMFQIIDV